MTSRQTQERRALSSPSAANAGEGSPASLRLSPAPIHSNIKANESRKLGCRICNRSDKARGVTEWHLSLTWTVSDTDLVIAASRRGQALSQIAGTVRCVTGKACAPFEVERLLGNSGVSFAENSA